MWFSQCNEAEQNAKKFDKFIRYFKVILDDQAILT